MSVLPNGWIEATLDEFFTLVRGLTYAKQDVSLEPSEKHVALLRANNIQNGKIDFDDLIYLPRNIVKDEQIVREDDIVMATSSGSRTVVGKMARVTEREEGITFGAFCGVLRPRYNEAGAYLIQYMKSRAYRDYVEAVAIGTNINNFRSSDIQRMTIPLAPLAEQKRIVAKLDVLNAKSERARAALTRIETLVTCYKQAVLRMAFSGELTVEWQQVQGLKSWTNAKPEDLFKWSSGKNLPSRNYVKGTVPVIGGNGVSGYHDSSNVETPTIVIGRVGAQCGNVYHSLEPAWITDNAIYAKWISSEVDLRFAVLVYEKADLNKLSGGTGQPYVNQSTLNSIDFPLPSREEQLEIVCRIESAFASIDRLAAEAKRALKLVDKLDEVVLAKAFRGGLVQQDENDEPASVLLERIRAEREAAPRTKSKKIRREMTMPTARDFLNAKLDNWPIEGVCFQDLMREFGGSYDDLKEAVFALLSDKQSELTQVFDEKTSKMTIRKRA